MNSGGIIPKLTRHVLPLAVSAVLIAVVMIWYGDVRLFLLLAVLVATWLAYVLWLTRPGEAPEPQDTVPVDATPRVDHHFLEQTRMLMSEECKALRRDTEQVRGLLRDAISTLERSFDEMNGNCQREAEIVLDLINVVSDDTTTPDSGDRIRFQEFTENTNSILQYFVSHVVEISESSMAMVHRVDDLSAEITQINTLLMDVKAIADQTNLLALNAAIEAARAGEAGRGFAVVADEVRKLSRNSEKFSDEITTVVKRSLERLEDARGIIAKMASKDMSVAIQSKANIDDMIQRIGRMNSSLERRLEEVSVLADRMGSETGRAVTSLQFEDITTQILGHMGERLRVFEELTSLQMDAVRECYKSLPAARAEEYRTSFINARQRLEQVSRKPAAQTNMGEGDVELF